MKTPMKNPVPELPPQDTGPELLGSTKTVSLRERGSKCTLCNLYTVFFLGGGVRLK